VVHDQDLLDAIQLALEKDRSRRGREMGLAALRERFESLSPESAKSSVWSLQDAHKQLQLRLESPKTQ